MLGFVGGYLIGWGVDSQLQKMHPGPLRVLSYIATWIFLFIALTLVKALILHSNGMSTSGPSVMSMATGMTVAFIVLSSWRRRDKKYAPTETEQPDPNIKTGVDRALEAEPEDEEWELLRRFDAVVRDALEIVKPNGEEAVSKLRQAFRDTGDKHQLKRIAEEINSEYEVDPDGPASDHSSKYLMQLYGITRVDGQFAFRDHRYEELENAIAVAKRTLDKSI